MSHSYNKIWIHAIWATKNRQKLITQEVEGTLYPFLLSQFKDLDCPVRVLNGMPDHVHCLFLLDANKSVAEVLKQVKGSSSHFINQEDLIIEKFAWQTGYGAFSVSESGIQKVQEYIRYQKQHHQVRSFEQEYTSFLSLHGFKENKLSNTVY